MALTVTQFPFLFAWANNPLPLKVEAGSSWQGYTPQSDWIYWIVFGSNLVSSGETITFIIGGTSYSVQVVPTGATIGDNGLLVYENPSITNIDDWINNTLIPTLDQNFTFSQYLTFTPTLGGVLFISAPYNQFLSVTTTIAGASAAQTSAGAAAIFPENYHIVADLLVKPKNQGDYKKAASIKAIPEKSSPFEAKFNFSEIVKTYVNRDLPTFKLTTVETTQNSNICKMKVAFAEGWNTPCVYQGKNETSELFCFHGGIYEEYLSLWGLYTPFQLLFSWLSYLPFLPKKPTTINSPEYLYYFLIGDLLSSAATMNVRVQGTVTYTDGYTISAIFYPSQSLDRYKTHIFPMGYNALNLGALLPTQEVKTWTAQVIDDTTNDPISGVVTYELEARQYPEREKYFIFGTSLGAYDTLTCTSQFEVGIKIDKSTFLSYQEWDSPKRKKTTNRLSAKKTVKVSTTWVSKQYIQYLQDFIISDDIYEMVDGKYVPITIETDTIQLYRKDSFLYSLSFEYSYDTNQNIYTPQTT